MTQDGGFEFIVSPTNVLEIYCGRCGEHAEISRWTQAGRPAVAVVCKPCGVESVLLSPDGSGGSTAPGV